MLQKAKSTFAKDHNTIVADKGPHHEKLSALIGRWKVHGHNGAMSGEDGGDIVDGTESYEWCQGDYFLLNRWDRTSVSGPFSGIGWIGYDAASEKYRSYSISNTGFFRIYEMEISEGLIKYIGEKERGSVTVSADRSVMHIYWQQKVGENWETICRLTAQKFH